MRFIPVHCLKFVRLAGLAWALVGLASTALPAQTLQLNPAAGAFRSTSPTNASEPTAPASVAPKPPPTVAQSYFYVEPHQARFEVLFDAVSLLQLTDPGVPPPAVLTVELQKRLCATLAEKASNWCLTFTGEVRVEAEFLPPIIVRGQPGATLPVEPEAEVPLTEAMVGFQWQFAIPPVPEELSVEWRGWLPSSQVLPVRLFFGPLSEPSEIRGDFPRLTWRNQGRLPPPTPLAEVPNLPKPVMIRLPLACLIWVLGGVVFIVIRLRSRRRMPTAIIGAWALGAVVCWPLLVIQVPLPGHGPVAVQDPAAAEAILKPLLRNAYRAFDQRSESAIYDVLERSVDGELLRRLYLETLQALTLDGREGTRVTLNDFDATVSKVSPLKHGFVADCQWTALGTVGHWGHSHTRINRYTARVTAIPVRGEWKLVDLEVSEARRL